jgi:hypothetical protein
MQRTMHNTLHTTCDTDRGTQTKGVVLSPTVIRPWYPARIQGEASPSRTSGGGSQCDSLLTVPGPQTGRGHAHPAG